MVKTFKNILIVEKYDLFNVLRIINTIIYFVITSYVIYINIILP